jgi:hypothetical protein
MNGHRIVICKLCDRIISQCKCIMHDKPIVNSICEECKEKEK